MSRGNPGSYLKRERDPLIRRMFYLEVDATTPAGEVKQSSVDALAGWIRSITGEPRRYIVEDKLVRRLSNGSFKTDIREQRLAQVLALKVNESVILSNFKSTQYKTLSRLLEDVPFPTSRRWLGGDRLRLTREE